MLAFRLDAYPKRLIEVDLPIRAARSPTPVHLQRVAGYRQLATGEIVAATWRSVIKSGCVVSLCYLYYKMR